MADGKSSAVAQSGDWETVPQDEWETVQSDPSLTRVGTNPAGFPIYHGTPAQKPGFVSRFAESVGIPTSFEQVKGMFTPQPIDLLGPGGRVAQMMVQGATQPMTPVEKADLEKHPVGQVVNQVAKRTLEGPLVPVGGQAVSNIATDQGNLGAQAGDVLGSLVNLLGLRKAVGPSTEGQLNKLTYAAGAKASGPLEKTVGMLNSTADAHGMSSETIGGLKDLVNKAKDNINTEFGNALGPHANMQMVPTEVSTRILDLITPDMQFTKEGRGEIAAIKNAALEYQKPWTLGALDSKRSRLAADLASHSAKEGVARYTAEKGNINLAIDNAANDALRDTVYPQADQLAGKPPGYFEDLKQKQSNLIRLEQILNKRITDLQGAQRAQEGAPLGSNIRGGIYATSEGAPHGYIGNLVSFLRSTAGIGGPLKEANAAVKSGFSKGGPISQSIVLSYPVRKLALDQPTPWWDTEQK